MLVPYSWLTDLLPGLPSAPELAEVLTLGGLEVEEIRDWTSEDAAASDQVLVTSVTSNRGDLLSLLGVARQAAALLDLPFTPPAPPLDLLGGVVQGDSQAVSGPVTVETQDLLGCPRYGGLLLEDLKVGPSPDWLRWRLEASGIRPINNVVDVTNYVCWELGQPMHAFDFRFLHSGHVLIRRARPGDELLLLDETLPPLTEEDLVIADPLGPVALAGVMGGADSQVRESTTRVLLEAAHFDPTSVRRTSLRLGKSTESSYRFERHVDPSLPLLALARAAQLLGELAGARVAGPALDVRTLEFAPRELSLRPARCNALLGTDLTPAQMAACLRRLGCEVAEGEPLTVRVPTVRPDVEREVDLIEEVAIVHGYNRLPTTLPGRLHHSGRLTPEQRLERRAREILRRCGLNETLSFSQFCAPDLDRLGCPPDSPERCALTLSNPMIAEQNLLRTTLLPALLQAAAYNRRQRVRDLALYELSRVFLPLPDRELPEEPLRVAGLLAGCPFTSAWNLPPEVAQVDFYWLKSVVEQFLTELGVEGFRFVAGERATFAPTACAQVLLGEQSLGWLGEIAPEVAAAYDLEGDFFAFELDFSAVLAAATLVRPYCPLPRFPVALRDVAVAVPDTDEFTAARLCDEIRAAAGELVETVRPFDLYRDPERLGPGLKSLAFELVFRAPGRTLTDEELDAAMSRVHARLEALGGQVRKS